MSVKLKALLKSPWVFHLSTGSCNNCDIEILDCLTPRFDVERFGMLLAASIKHADVLLVTGSGNRKSMERVKRLYDQMPKPAFVVAIGECSLSRGMFIHSYNCPV
ncbi:MAG: NADH-quinone oxidoreductase subunit B, partial [Candidatus Omnitrophota bacterium]